MIDEEMTAGVEEIHAAWKAFERRLLTLVEAMDHPQDRLVLELGRAGGVPTVSFGIDEGELVATIGDDEYREHIPGREPIVHRAIMLLRNIAGVPHPELLTHHAAGPVARLSRVLGLAWTPGFATLPQVVVTHDRGELIDYVEEALMEDHEVGRDGDGDLFVDHVGQRVFVRVLPGADGITIFTRVAHGARSRRQAAVEVGILNRTSPWVRWQVLGRDIVQTATVDSAPFVPQHLMSTLELFFQAMSTRDDLALRVGGEVA